MGRDLVDHAGDVTAVISRMIDDVKQDVAAAHRAGATANESEIQYLLAGWLSQALRVAHIPGIDTLLRVAQLRKRRTGFWIPRREFMGAAFKMSLPYDIHDVHMVQGAQDVAKDNLTLRNQLAFRVFRECLEEQIIGPCLVASEHLQLVNTGH